MTPRTASATRPRVAPATPLRLLLVRPLAWRSSFPPASAQDHATAAIAIAAPASDTTTKRTFSIPPQPLPAALEEFSRQSGLRVRTDTEVPVVRSAGVVGRLTPIEALRRLVAGTGLLARVVNDETLAVQQENPEAYVLDPVEVVAKRPAANADAVTSTATKTSTPLRDVPQAVTVVSRKLIADQGMQSMADVARYVPGVTMGQGEGNRDQPTIRGNNSTSTFFVNGVRDDVQYFRDLYNVERVEGLKGANALIFGRGTGGGVINRVTKEAEWAPTREVTVQGGSYGTRRGAVDVGQGVSETVALRLNGMYENSDRFRRDVNVERYGINPAVTLRRRSRHPDHGELRALLRLPHRRSRHPVVPGAPGRRRRADLLRRSLAELVRRPDQRGHGGHRARPRPRARAPEPHRLRRLQQDVPERLPGLGGLHRGAGQHVGLQQPERPEQPVQSDRGHLPGRDRLGEPHAARRRRGGPSGEPEPPEHRLLRRHRDLGDGAARQSHDLAGRSPSGRARPMPTTAPGRPRSGCMCRTRSR